MEWNLNTAVIALIISTFIYIVKAWKWIPWPKPIKNLTGLIDQLLNPLGLYLLAILIIGLWNNPSTQSQKSEIAEKVNGAVGSVASVGSSLPEPGNTLTLLLIVLVAIILIAGARFYNQNLSQPPTTKRRP